jgi:1-acyl-sn-glycerol-3-phosphate acyltransferase
VRPTAAILLRTGASTGWVRFLYNSAPCASPLAPSRCLTGAIRVWVSTVGRCVTGVTKGPGHLHKENSVTKTVGEPGRPVTADACRFDITVEAAARPNRLFRILYGSYAWLALLACVLPVIFLIALTPDVHRRRRIARGGARLFFVLIGSPVRLSGQRLDSGQVCIVVANHASYLDGIILTAVLPPQFTFLIKHDMAHFPVAGFLLRRLGSEFVDRDNTSHRNRIVRRLVHAARNGDALALFPEGTFAAPPGLRRFHPGAFGAAWRAGLPVVPVVITGSRIKLPAGAFLSAPGPLSVHICTPLQPQEHASARMLMLASRAAILDQLHEPDLDHPTPEEPSAVDGIGNGDGDGDGDGNGDGRSE